MIPFSAPWWRCNSKVPTTRPEALQQFIVPRVVCGSSSKHSSLLYYLTKLSYAASEIGAERVRIVAYLVELPYLIQWGQLRAPDMIV
jgi:hypothetical protein